MRTTDEKIEDIITNVIIPPIKEELSDIQQVEEMDQKEEQKEVSQLNTELLNCYISTGFIQMDED